MVKSRLAFAELLSFGCGGWAVSYLADDLIKLIDWFEIHSWES